MFNVNYNQGKPSRDQHLRDYRSESSVLKFDSYYSPVPKHVSFPCSYLWPQMNVFTDTMALINSVTVMINITIRIVT